jgi:HTH-type transcriptional regulator/antitoxin HigA
MWLTHAKAMLLLGIDHETDDQFWFSFFHAAGHIVLHGKRDVFIDDSAGASAADLAAAAAPVQAKKEQEADAFAGNLLVFERAWRRFVLAQAPDFPMDRICKFARQQRVTPGIVVGRLQRAGHLSYSHCNELKTALDWTSLGTV